MTHHPPTGWKALAESLPIPDPWSVERFGGALARQRSRRLILTAARLPAGHPGLLVALPAADLIIYPRADDAAIELRAIAHQLGHLLLGHQGAPASHSPFLHLPPNATARIEITRFTPPEETAAEEFAAQFTARVSPSSVTRPFTMDETPNSAD